MVSDEMLHAHAGRAHVLTDAIRRAGHGLQRPAHALALWADWLHVSGSAAHDSTGCSMATAALQLSKPFCSFLFVVDAALLVIRFLKMDR